MIVPTLPNIPWADVVAFVSIVGAVWRIGAKVVKRIEKVAAQFSPNGGSTLRDAIDRVEQSVVFSEKRSRILYDSGDVNRGWFEATKSGSCTHVSNSWCRMHSAQRDEALGYGWLNQVSESSRESFVDAWHHATTDNRSFDTEYVSASGRSFHLHAERVTSSRGELLGFIGFTEATTKENPHP